MQTETFAMYIPALLPSWQRERRYVAHRCPSGEVAQFTEAFLQAFARVPCGDQWKRAGAARADQTRAPKGRRTSAKRTYCVP